MVIMVPRDAVLWIGRLKIGKRGCGGVGKLVGTSSW